MPEALLGPLRRLLDGVGRRERILLALAMTAAAALALVHAIATKDFALIGDERFYDPQARLFADGHFFQSVHPLTELHETAWKTPGFPTWMGSIYTVLGSSPTKLGVVQALILTPLTVFLGWLLARRLFGPTVAVVTAWLVALMPLVWEAQALLLPEALAVPVTLVALILILDRGPSTRIAILAGIVIGIAVLIRPNSFFLLAGALAAWVMAVGVRRGLLLSVIAAGAAVLVVVPWSIRNLIVTDAFIPLSLQDAAGYGTFNDEAASDPDHPYRWRATFANGTEPAFLLPPRPGVTEPEIRSRLSDMMFDYISEHPDSVPKAFFWNGIVRLWDLQPPGDGLDAVGFSSHSRTVRLLGLVAHLLLLPFVAMGLWRLRRRPRLLVPILAMFAVLSVTVIVDATTRYRLPVEPLLIIVAASTLPASWRRLDASPAQHGSPRPA